MPKSHPEVLLPGGSLISAHITGFLIVVTTKPAVNSIVSTDPRSTSLTENTLNKQGTREGRGMSPKEAGSIDSQRNRRHRLWFHSKMKQSFT
jgi:hypothetical protein